MSITKISNNLAGLKVLIAEDDLLSVMMIQQILSGWHIDASVAKKTGR